MSQYELNNLNDVRRVARRTGNHFFDRDTMQWWQGRICESLTRTAHDGKVWFIASDKMRYHPEFDEVPPQREYRVRVAQMIGDRLNIDTIGEPYVSSKDAYRGMVRAMRSEG